MFTCLVTSKSRVPLLSKSTISRPDSIVSPNSNRLICLNRTMKIKSMSCLFKRVWKNFGCHTSLSFEIILKVQET